MTEGKVMKKISEFAKLCGTSSKTLRFYEKVGLLKAAYTNSENGYRYYDDEQYCQYKLITVFKEIGFTLDEMPKQLRERNDIASIDDPLLGKGMPISMNARSLDATALIILIEHMIAGALCELLTEAITEEKIIIRFVMTVP